MQDQHETSVASIAESSKATAKVLTDKDKLAQAAGLPTQDVVQEAKGADPAAVEEDPLADLTGPALAPVSDAELNAAVQTKNKEIKDPVRIRSVVAEFNGGPGKVLADIPQEKRHEFLDKLKVLKAA